MTSRLKDLFTKFVTAVESPEAGRLKNLLLIALAVAVCWLLIQSHNAGKHNQKVLDEVQSALADVARYSVAAVQSNVDARHDDCQQVNTLRAGLRSQVAQSQTTAPLLYKLVPSLNNPTVRALVKANYTRELREYAAVDCKSYARRAIPAGDTHHYHVP